jgi:hypothetical protein
VTENGIILIIYSRDLFSFYDLFRAWRRKRLPEDTIPARAMLISAQTRAKQLAGRADDEEKDGKTGKNDAETYRGAGREGP